MTRISATFNSYFNACLKYSDSKACAILKFIVQKVYSIKYSVIVDEGAEKLHFSLILYPPPLSPS